MSFRRHIWVLVGCSALAFVVNRFGFPESRGEFFDHSNDPQGDIVGSTVGVGLSLDWDSLPVGIRADYASRPQASGLPRVDLWSVQLMKVFD